MNKPEYAESLIWTLDIEDTPVYAIRPEAFCLESLQADSRFSEGIDSKKVERISIPGVIAGKVTLFSGQKVPVIKPELRGMCSWTLKALIKSVKESALSSKLKISDEEIRKQYIEYTTSCADVLRVDDPRPGFTG